MLMKKQKNQENRARQIAIKFLQKRPLIDFINFVEKQNPDDEFNQKLQDMFKEYFKSVLTK